MIKTSIALSLLLSSAAFTGSARAAKAAPQEVAARQQEPSVTLAPKVGLFVPTSSLSSAVYLGLEAGWVTPLFDRRLTAVVELGWTRPRGAGVLVDPRLVGGAGGEYTLGNAEVGILLSAVYRFVEAAAGLTPYAGAGPGLYFHRTTINAFGSRQTETEARFGLQLLGGAELRMGPGALFGELRYHFTRVDFLITGNRNVGGFVLPALGYRLSL